MKQCSRVHNIEKPCLNPLTTNNGLIPLSEFRKYKREKDGLSCACKFCLIKDEREKSEEKKQYFINNREKILKRQQKFYYANQERLLKEKKESNIRLGKNTGKTFITVPETIIKNWLKKQNIEFEFQKSFNKLHYFDFFLPNKNIIIEFDGIFHFEPIYGIEKFNREKERDKIKEQFCIDNGIKLIRISYKENIEEKLCVLR